MNSKFLILIFLLCSNALFAQKLTDREIFNRYKSTIHRQLPMGELIVATGRFFLDKPYVAATLEVNPEEKLVINLREFDCTTFVESSLALSLTAKSKRFTYENYKSIIKSLRYRGGQIDNYTSRLHYFSDWIFENQNRGVISDVTQSIGGDSVRYQVGFMSAHPDKYKALRENPDFVPIIAQQEETINHRTYFYIPKCRIEAIASRIESGDIIAIVTNIKGLEISHLGIAVWESGVLRFLNASSRTNINKVIISENTLAEYAQNNKTTTGIVVLRVKDPD